MAEPQPTDIQEGDHVPSAEDRKAAAALSNLDANTESNNASRQADTEALGRAMQDLNVRSDATAGAQQEGVNSAVTRKVAKVDATDVTLLVQQLDIPKSKATELLKRNNADVTQSISAWLQAL
ncbi:hypothetical protein AAFC00_000317 [Neodothiora populina]|uniref:Nascent polypeptide-associated complex subunit alpha-like UBA domain-containing protein n=1 Tax=Neodothiora populina TaxID=2781224 RepID=A0ABR3PDP5_9PEZI